MGCLLTWIDILNACQFWKKQCLVTNGANWSYSDHLCMTTQIIKCILSHRHLVDSGRHNFFVKTTIYPSYATLLVGKTYEYTAISVTWIEWWFWLVKYFTIYFYSPKRPTFTKVRDSVDRCVEKTIKSLGWWFLFLDLLSLA